MSNAEQAFAWLSFIRYSGIVIHSILLRCAIVEDD
jgi:hypothetical protein